MSKCYDDTPGRVADALRALVAAIMEENGADLLPVHPDSDPENWRLIHDAREALLEYDIMEENPEDTALVAAVEHGRKILDEMRSALEG